MKYNIDLNKYNQNYSNNHILLVPNQRLARKLVAAACGDKHKVISGFNIYSLTDFVNNIYNILAESGRIKAKYVLSIWQREVFLKKIISEFIDNNISADSIAEKIIQAWSLTQHWLLDAELNISPDLTPEISLFNTISKAYQAKLIELNYLDPDDKINQIIKILDQDLIKLLNLHTIDFYGFDDISILYQKLFNKLSDLGVLTAEIMLDFSGVKNKIQLCAAHDQDHEIKIIAAWAYSKYINKETDIGIIVPNLGQLREKYTRAFEDIFPNRDAWNISGGTPLSQIAVVKTALIILNLISKKKLILEEIIYFLQSRYYLRNDKKADYQSAVDNLIKQLRFHGYVELTINNLLFYIKNINQPLAEIISNYCDENQGVKLPSEWGIIISQILANFGWPAGQTNYLDLKLDNQKSNIINSQDYQAIMQFQSCCLKLAELDKIYGSISFTKVIEELKNLLTNTPFQIETDSNSIDILGMLEGAGLHYNQLWIANLTSDVWPSSPDPNPFIAVELQRKYNLPHSTVVREFEYAKNLTHRYLNSSNDITVSYNKFDAEKENDLSLLITSDIAKDFFKNDINLNIKPNLTSTKLNQNLFKYYYDTHGPVITNNHIKSGVKALGLQVLCPFRAFAEIRLGASHAFNLEIGPAKWLRGQVIHEVLQYFYLEFTNKTKILELMNNCINYNNYLNNLILEVLNKYKAKYQNIFKIGIINIEQEIIYKIIAEFINYETHRDDFAVIAVEQSCLFKINNIQFNVRVDRVDNVLSINNNSGSDQLLIIDYKTVEQNINSLFKEELTDPQLPVYLFLDKFNNTQAIIFAELLYQKVAYKGVGNRAVVDGCLKVNSWEELKTKWHGLLEQIAADFASGNAVVNPLYQEQTCRSCHLSSLCRKDEAWI